MPEILLTTINAKYIHCSFGLRYLFANLGELQSQAQIVEFEIHQRPVDIAEELLRLNPKIIGIGVYIWNAPQSLALVKILKKVAPQVKIILGGPEVSFETDLQEITQYADLIICGEADLQFATSCREILSNNPITQKIIHAKLPELSNLTFPYKFYSEKDIAHRIVYVEASRGCPFTCEFCLSSLDIPVRQFEIEPFLAELQLLLDRGVKHFKFVDRTFNLNLNISKAILEFFEARIREGLFLHFEMIPDRLPEKLRSILARFPQGMIQLEVGIQSFNPEVNKLISRRQDFEKLSENIRFLRSSTGVHIHADLIAGLPGETIESFAEGFNRLLELDPQEIQVGILKRLRGTPIIRHDAEWQMCYSSDPPYEVLHTKLLSFEALQKIGRFARFWDLLRNSGNFVETSALIWKNSPNAFESFMSITDWLYKRFGRRHSIALLELTKGLWDYLTQELSTEPKIVAQALHRDWQRCKRKELPDCIKPYIEEELKVATLPGNRLKAIRHTRQSRHMQVNDI